MNNHAYDSDEQQFRSLMDEHGLTEAEARISCAINANVAKDFDDVRVVNRPGLGVTRSVGQEIAKDITDQCVMPF